jgi:hypothetical protein
MNDPTFTPYISVDEVTYDEHTPWPSAIGAALARVSPVNYAGSASSWVVSSQPGEAIYQDTDFTGDGIVTAGDADRLLDAVQQGADHSFFDVNNDGAVNAADIDALLASIDSLAGDANLDGMVNAAELNQVGLHWHRAHCMTWSDGDFTGDGAVTAADLNIVGIHWQRAMAAQRAALGQRLPRAPLAAAVDNLPFAATEPIERIARQSARDNSLAPTPTELHADTSSLDSRPRYVRYQRSLQPRTVSKRSQDLVLHDIDQPVLDAVFANEGWLF